MSKNHFLLIGPRFPKSSEKIGGAVVLFEDLIEYCKKENIDFKVIDNNKLNYQNTLVGYIKILYSIMISIRKAQHVSLHGTATSFLYIAPLAVLMASILNKRISLRKFAGNFDEIYFSSKFIKRKIFYHTLKNADFLFFETKNLVDKFSFLNSRVHWWPNSRFEGAGKIKKEEFSKKFVFISHVKKTKGIYEFIEASKKFDETYTFDVYGPIMDPDLNPDFFRKTNLNYRGILEPNEVEKTLSNYDVLVLPTYHEGEGYPGIIIESFAAGIPVISTNWKSITEIVQNNYNGLLVQIKNSDELYSAIASFDNLNYSSFSKNAARSFSNFNSKFVYSNFFNEIKFNK